MSATVDRDTVAATALDYFEGWFDGDAVRMERALHPDLCKRAIRPDGSVNLSSAQEMIDDTREGIGKALRPTNLEIRVRVEDVYEDLANVTVDSTVYREYLQLVRTPDGWKILNALYCGTV